MAERLDLDSLTIRRPCSASWEAMERVTGGRHCSLCQRSVRDLSALTRGEAEALLREATGRLCVRIVRHPDGRVVTRNAGERRAPGGALERLSRRILGGLSLLAAACGAADQSPAADTAPREEVASPAQPAPPEAASRSEEERVFEQLGALGYVAVEEEPSAEALPRTAAAASPCQGDR